MHDFGRSAAHDLAWNRETDVDEDEPLAVDGLAHLDLQRPGEHRPGDGYRVELPIFATGVDAGGQISEERMIEPAP